MRRGVCEPRDRQRPQSALLDQERQEAGWMQELVAGVQESVELVG